MRTPSPPNNGLDLTHLWLTGLSRVSPSIAARYFSAGPSDSTSRWTPCPPKYSKRKVENKLSGFSLPVALGWAFAFAAAFRFGLALFPITQHLSLPSASEELPPLLDMTPLI
jgi:hypothetical protein